VRESDIWSTPRDFFEALNAIFHFDIDVCALPENAKCPRSYLPQDDGLTQPWTGNVWCNRPYSRPLPWMRKAWESSEAGATVVCLVKVSTGSRWWQTYCTKGAITYLRGRLKFSDAKNVAPFDSAVILFSKTFLGEVLQCIECDKPFAAKRSHAKVCSNRYQVGMHRQERRAAA
jgi:phage N-6-adenine-methyltransferase